MPSNNDDGSSRGTNNGTAHYNNNFSTMVLVHPEERPTTILVNPSFNGSNYYSWTRSMKRALITKHKRLFLDENIKILDDFG